MTTLRTELSNYVRDWRDDLPPAWAHFFQSVEPDIDSVDPRLRSESAYPIIPGRRSSPHPGAPAEAHVFRAFDRTDPESVKVVVIGQDPYPLLSRATGRAFEDGLLGDWRGPVALSLQRLVQSALQVRSGRAEFVDPDRGWIEVKRGIASGSLTLESPSAFFDRLQFDHGVLFVNAAWTLTKYARGGCAEQEAHLAFWAPVMYQLLNGMAERDAGSVVYLVLGGFAKKIFAASGVETSSKAAETWGVSVAKVENAHPSADATPYFARPNPLGRVNDRLEEMGASLVRW
ncbi:hypothetical protein GCM10009819_24640 [Agromyces tropicus]|uniref:Uracil-DNA glycosylase n=1 Tax=Agromyces tropicus TaxID=555371 RepID=A0ABN2ULM2_9MICO